MKSQLLRLLLRIGWPLIVQIVEFVLKEVRDAHSPTTTKPHEAARKAVKAVIESRQKAAS